MTVRWTTMDSPVGGLRVASDGHGLVGLSMEPWTGVAAPAGEPGMDAVLAQAVEELTDYFAGRRHDFDLPRSPIGTAFQRTVWDELVRVPCGETVSYGELARRIGRPTAVRAVARANATNPIGIVVPCHRVIGSNGTLTGYAGGLDRKQWLLIHEGGVLA
jgi:methylated-DNA-[protein]-cysteine S-methyltransferase